MKVLVTGGTGFVGSHSVKALRDAGHEVRLLVRSPERIAAALRPLGVEEVEHQVGDVTDSESVRRALDGCEATLHAASIYSLDARMAKRVEHDNMRGAELVLGTAAELGLDPIVHVSSNVALLPSEGTIGPDSPPGNPKGPYARSKAETERLARQLQADGRPVTITQPGMVWGWPDPHFGEAARLAHSILRGMLPLIPGGILSIVHVGDVAAAHAALIEPGRGPRRYLLAGEDVPLPQVVGTIRKVTGRRLPSLALPAPLVLGSATLADATQRVLPFRLPLGREGVWLVVNGGPSDSSRAVDELGVSFRPAAQAIAETVRGLYTSGRISSRQAGLAAQAA